MGKKDDAMLGYSLGYPMYHALTGNLPVVSRDLHTSGNPAGANATAEADVDNLQKGWVTLVDPVTGQKFWWNINYRSRRNDKPDPGDDGRKGRGRGDHSAQAAARAARHAARMAGKTWEERYDIALRRTWYLNRKTMETQWERPDTFWDDGDVYRSVWTVRAATEAMTGYPLGAQLYVNTKTGAVTMDMPSDYDGRPASDTWELRTGGLWSNWLTGETSITKPESLTSALKAPTVPETGQKIPAPNATDEEVEAFYEEQADLEDDLEEADEKVYPSIRGWLKKRGGGYSGVMAGTSYQPRYFVSEAGILTYYAKEADVSSKKGPKKGWRINLRYYGVNSLPGDPTRFCLVPTPDAFTAYTHAAGDGMPPPDRVFEIEAENSGAKGNWVEALKGKSSSGEKDAEIARDTTEETEATKAAQKQARHAAEGRGVYRVASKAALRKDNAASEYRKKLLEQAAAAGLGVPVSVHGPMGQPVAHATSSRHIEVPPTMGGRRSSVESGGTPPGGRRSSLEGSSRSLRRSSLTMNSKSTGEGLVAQPAAQLPPPPPPAGLPPPPPPPPAR